MKAASASADSHSKSFLRNADISAGIFAQLGHATSNSVTHQTTSLSAGALFSFHQSYHWWLGYDVNYGYTSFSEQYRDGVYGVGCPASVTPGPCGSFGYANVHTGMHELTAAYLVSAPVHPLGLRPYGEAGVGELIFSPTNTTVTFSNAPESPLAVSTQHRIAALYGAGFNAPILTSHLGARFEYRNLWYTAPSFGNHGALDSTRAMLTQEPVASVYFKF